MTVTESQRQTIRAVLEAAAGSTPDGVLVEFEGRSFTCRDVLARAERMHTVLHGLGLGKGDFAMLMVGNSIEFIDSWLGMALSGIVEVAVNTAFKGEILRHVIVDSGVTHAVVDAEFVPRIAALGERVGNLTTLVVIGETGAECGYEVRAFHDLVATSAEAGEPDSCAVYDWDLQAIMYTSGTTGSSKGVMISHAHAHTYTEAVVELLELHGDRYYAPLPLFHITGQWAILLACAMTGSTAILKRRFSTSSYWADIAATNANVSFLVGAMAQFVYRNSAGVDRSTPLERAMMVPVIDEVDDFRSRFGVRICSSYGSTEMNVPVRYYFDEVTDPKACGRLAPGYQIRIVDDHDRELPDGQVGELLLRPTRPWTTLAGYHARPEATSAAFSNLWLHTGDLVRRDPSGYFYFVDRVKDAIRRRGENISSWEVEREVNAHPAVLDCAAVAAPSEYTEDDVRIFVIPRPGMSLDARELQRFIAERAPKFMVPRYVEIIDEFPKTETGKVQKVRLRARSLTEPLD